MPSKRPDTETETEYEGDPLILDDTDAERMSSFLSPNTSQSNSNPADEPAGPASWLKKEEEIYSQGDDRPLGSYLLLLGTYSAFVAGVAAAVRLSRKKLPESISTRDLVVVGIATHKVSRILSKDPVTSPIRAPLTIFQGTDADAELSEKVRGKGLKHAVGELVTFPFCLDQWVATSFLSGLVLFPRLARVVASLFTVTALADVLQHVYVHLQD